MVEKKGNQVGGTEWIFNTIGFYADIDPCNIQLALPTLVLAEGLAKTRIRDLFRHTPCLRGVLRDPRARDAENAILEKHFQGPRGGRLKISGVNSPASLQSDPQRVVIGDEVSLWTRNSGAEGDPLRNLEARTDTYWDSKQIWISRPSVEGACRISELYDAGTQEVWMVACPLCQLEQEYRFGGRDTPYGYKWTSGAPASVRYQCGGCGGLWDEATRRRAILAGRFVATNPAAPSGYRSFFVPGLLSLFATMERQVQRWLRAQGRPEEMQVVVTGLLGETWSVPEEGLDSEALQARAEDYETDPLPEGGAVITVGGDVHPDRIEAEAVLWGQDRRSWGLEYRVFHGDPSGAAIWEAVETWLRKTWRTTTGHKLPIAAACFDSGGHNTTAVYAFAARHFGRNVWAIRGKAGRQPLLGRPSRNNVGRVPVYPVGVDTAKNLLAGLLSIEAPGPGHQHIPGHYPPEWYRQMAAEHPVPRRDASGVPYLVWQLRKGERRNEGLDCRVYALGALEGLGIDVNAAVGMLQEAEERRRVDSSGGHRAARGEPRVTRGHPGLGRPSWLDDD